MQGNFLFSLSLISKMKSRIKLQLKLQKSMIQTEPAPWVTLVFFCSDISLGVLTKADLVPKGDHDAWLDIINNKSHLLKHGYYVTRQPSSNEITEGVSWEASRERERNFFTIQSPWCDSDRNRLGTEALTEALSIRLSHMIQER